MSIIEDIITIIAGLNVSIWEQNPIKNLNIMCIKTYKHGVKEGRG
jgi:hypothetical protein